MIQRFHLGRGAVENYLAEIEKSARESASACRGLFRRGARPEVKEKVRAGIALLESLGCQRIR